MAFIVFIVFLALLAYLNIGAWLYILLYEFSKQPHVDVLHHTGHALTLSWAVAVDMTDTYTDIQQHANNIANKTGTNTYTNTVSYMYSPVRGEKFPMSLSILKLFNIHPRAKNEF